MIGPDLQTRLVLTFTSGHFAWFADFIQTLSGSNKVAVNLHVTGNTPPPSSDGDKPYLATPPRSTTPIGMDMDADDADLEKIKSVPSTPAHSEHVTACNGNCGAHQICLAGNLDISEGRPDVREMIRREVESAGRTERILVIGCGPSSLMDDVRNATAASIQCEGPAVELHCEQFGW